MCIEEDISINPAHPAHHLPIMTLPQANDLARQLEADHYSSCFDFSHHGLSLEPERGNSESLLSIGPQSTEDSVADNSFGKAVAPITPTSPECLDESHPEDSVLYQILRFLERNPAECDEELGRALDELSKVGTGQDVPSNDDTTLARPLLSTQPCSQYFGGPGHMKGSLPAQYDLEDSIFPGASLPQEHSASWCNVFVRLVEVVIRIEPYVQHLHWNRRRALWCGGLGQDSWDKENLSCYVLAGLPFLSLTVRPCGNGFPVRLVWDEETQGFDGFDDMNGKWMHTTSDEVAGMLENPNAGAMISA